MSRLRSTKKAKYHLVCITDSFTEKIDFDDFENASDDLWGTYYSWMEHEKNSWRLFPTEEEKDEWDYMICNWWCYIEEYDPMTDEYKICYEPTKEKLEEFGWKCHTDFQKLTSM